MDTAIGRRSPQVQPCSYPKRGLRQFSGETLYFQYWHWNADVARPVCLSNAIGVTFE